MITVESVVVLTDEHDGTSVTVERLADEEDSRDGGQAYRIGAVWVSLAELRGFAQTILDTFPA